MSYEILGNTGKYWACNQHDWPDYLKLATAFGWVPEGAFFKCDEMSFGQYSSGSYLGNDLQQVTDGDGRAMQAALNLAVASVNAQTTLTKEQAIALEAFALQDRDPLSNYLSEPQRSAHQKFEMNYLIDHPRVVRTLRTGCGTFDVDMREIIALADAVGGGFTIA
jgi:hypothetical protein